MNILYFLFATMINAYSFKDCGSTTMIIENVVLAPEIPKTTENMTVNIFGYSNQVFRSGNVDVVLNYNNIPLYTLDLDFCKISQCPVLLGGNFTINYGFEIPVYAPLGNYALKMSVNDDKNVVGCVEIDTELSEIS